MLRNRGPLISLVSLGSIALAGHIASSPAQGADALTLRVLSSATAMVSGGEALIEVNTPNRDVRDTPWKVHLNGRDVTSAFHHSESVNKVLGLVRGLKIGKNIVTLSLQGLNPATLVLTNHPISGPILSGPHQEPFICQTEKNGLGPALDANCDAATVVTYYYKSTEPVPEVPPDLSFGNDPRKLDPGFKPYDLSEPTPPDVAQTVTSDQRTVPFIVRQERGVINRAVYEIRFLHKPGDPLPTPWEAGNAGWNGRLVYNFGGGCDAGYRQGELGLYSENPNTLVESGYAVATSTQNIFGNNCNLHLSAETLSMVKEYFVKRFGVPKHTIGFGGSGGAIQQHLIAQDFPGLLNGIVVLGAFPDLLVPVQERLDCALLGHVFETSKMSWSEEQKAAVSGFATWNSCIMSRQKIRFVDARACDAVIPKNRIFDPVTNPQGVRCDIYDNNVNVLGRDPRTGFARRPLDNEGVQYGLAALNAGKLDAERFLELNEKIGGFDTDGRIAPSRSSADRETVHIVYDAGLVFSGDGGLREVPIIDWRFYSDDLGDGMRFWSFVTRARLRAATGAADNQVIIVYPRLDLMSLLDAAHLSAAKARTAEHERRLTELMDTWLENIERDLTAAPLSVKVANNKPAELSDGCFEPSGHWISETASYDGPGRCNQLYPSSGDPRIAAGAPLTDDVLKCQLKPLSPADYTHPFSPAQLARLKAIFPSGVCDYTQPGVGGAARDASRGSLGRGVSSWRNVSLTGGFTASS